MTAHAYTPKPAVGMNLAFKPDASSSLAGIPARVTYVWPRFRSGDYLVTLEFPEPVKFRNTLIKHIDAFTSELEQLAGTDALAPATLGATVEARPLLERVRGKH